MPTRSTPPSDLTSPAAAFRAAALDAEPQTANEPAWRSEPMSPGQRKYIADLSVRLTEQAHQEWLTLELAKNPTKGRASDIIERLKVLPKPAAAKEAPSAPKVPEGRYALPEPSDSLNPVRFYTVDHGRDGSRWEGYTFVSRHSSDERWPVKGKERYRVLESIAADPEAASKLYGHETNHCGVCGRELTREDSRAAGIGPVCAAKQDWGF